MTIRIRNWSKHQHFKDRTPPWIKLYRDILDDPDWHAMSGDDAKLLVGLWLVASEDDTRTGALPDMRRLAFRLRITESQLNQGLNNLAHWLERDDIDAISPRHHGDAPETETETETEGETEGEGEVAASAAKAASPASADLAVILDAYHRLLPNCQRVSVMGPKRKRLIAAAVKQAKALCRNQGWPYDPTEFWDAYFTECAADPWLRGDKPNPKNPDWKQKLDTVLDETRFTAVMDRALATMRASA